MELFMRYPEGKKKALTFSYDDGVEQDIRLTGLMDQYGIKGTFNINSGLFTPEGTVFPEGQIHRRMTKSQVLNLWKGTHHEIAAHTLTHPFLGKIPYECAMSEILEDRRNLEEMFEYPVRGMYLCRELTDLSYPAIGQEFGGKDHTTVMYAADKISKDIEKDETLKKEILFLIKDIKTL